jgi:hypothetical protein
MTGDNREHTMIADIKRLLDAELPDADTRAALQQARIRALSATGKRQRTPWLEFAVAASLVAVVAVNLPRPKPAAVPAPATAVARTPASANAVKTAVTPQPVKPTSPSAATPQAKPVASQATAIDMDLLENLDLYEDTEFYEWLSEQEGEGVLDA